MRLRHGFWTTYKRFFVETLLARGVSRSLIAAKLGVSQAQVRGAINSYGLRARDLLDMRDE